MEPQQPSNRERQEEENDAQEYDTFLYKFQQQIIDAWKPVPHTGSNVILYIILSTICIGLGLGLVLSAPNYQEVNVRYDQTCAVGTTNCAISFTLTQNLPAPVYLYYGFKGFYQNHRRYLKYFSSGQLDTGTVNPGSLSTDCGDFVTNLQTFGTGAVSRTDGTTVLVDSENAFPCGTIARFFYMLYPEINAPTMTGPVTPTISQTGIAWPSDIGRHVNPSNYATGFDVTDEKWLVWFRPAARSTFYKLNGIINQQLPAGTYTLTIPSITIDATFGQKWISLSKSNFVGNRDLFLGIAFLVLGVGCLLLLVVFLSKWIAQKRDRQKFE